MKILLKRHEMFMVPLKDLAVFPRMVVPLFVGRRRSLRSVEEAMRLGRPLFLVSQRKTGVEEPDERDVHDVGTVARVLQMLKLPDGKIRLPVSYSTGIGIQTSVAWSAPPVKRTAELACGCVRGQRRTRQLTLN